jgi:hypothetical protein
VTFHSVQPAAAASRSHPSVAQAEAVRLAGLPTDRLHFGLASGPPFLDWMTSSGVPWHYRYQYLVGGVNTGTGWETWNSPSGAFALYYMQASTTAPASYIPMLVYYELLQSKPGTGSGESGIDYANLNDTSTMSAYFGNFKLLLQQAHSYGQTAVIDVEPDFWGYMEQRAAGGGANTVAAAVASSGYPDAAGMPNTVQGFAWTLLKMRDAYAPNALMVIDASPWATGTDISSSTSSSLNITALADAQAAFLNSAGMVGNPSGVSSWDVVSTDPDDHDAGWWEAMGYTNAGFTHWWDPTNKTFPNFSRWLAWVGELHLKTGRPLLAWQVPVGNQYYLTMNNTCGHYQDNIAQYFLSHVSDLSSAGLLAVLFGSGNSCQTEPFDNDPADGVTNGSGSAVNDPGGWCSACNTHISTVSDNDGGYLRVFVGQYYGATPCSGAAISAVPASPAAPATTVTWTGSATGCPNPRFRFWELDPGSRWSMVQDYSATTTYTWHAPGLGGSYRFEVDVRDASSSAAYDAVAASTYTLQASSCANATLAVAPPTPGGTGVAVTMTGGSSSCPNPRYRFWVKDPGSRWSMVQDYSPATTHLWTQTGAAGTYALEVDVRDAAETTAYDTVANLSYVAAGCGAATLSPSPTAPQPHGTQVTLTGGATCLGTPTYRFWVRAPGGSWRIVRDYSTSSSFAWTPASAGTYSLEVDVRDQGATASYETVANVTYGVM